MQEYVVTAERDEPFEDRHGAGWYVKETWKLDSVIHRYHGPAVVIRHPFTLQSVREEFYYNGLLHRYGGPAVIIRDPDDGHILQTQDFEHGKAVPSPNIAIPDEPRF